MNRKYKDDKIDDCWTKCLIQIVMDRFQSRKQTAFQVMESMVTKTADVIDRQLQLLEDSLDDPNSRPGVARSNTTGSIRDRPAQSP